MGCKHSQLGSGPKKGKVNVRHRLSSSTHHHHQQQQIGQDAESEIVPSLQSEFGNGNVEMPTTAEGVFTKEKIAADDKGSVVEECLQLEQVQVHCMETTSISIDRIPPEVWDLVFENLHDFRDCFSAYNASLYWRDVLHPSKSSWLFSMVFPMILEHLSKSDILHCRLVCRRWCFGVDHFLENCAYHRPALEVLGQDLNGKVTKFHNTDLRLQYMENTLRSKKLAYLKLFNADRMNNVLVQAINHPRCPFIGRSVDILESNGNPLPPPNMSFLQAFGHFLHYIQFVIENYSPLESLKQLYGMISELPNLKQLKAIVIIVSASKSKTKWPKENLNLGQKPLSKLETLDLIILPTRHVRIVEELLTLFGNEYLQTFSSNVIPVAPNWHQMTNMSYLTISLDSDKRLGSLLNVKASLQRLSFRLHGRVNKKLLFAVVRHFQKTLRNFTLSLCPDFFPILMPPTFLATCDDPFSIVSTLSGFPHVKRTMISTWRPISLNYLCGLHNTLEYLHISLKGMDEWEEDFLKIFSKSRRTNQLDILEFSKRLTTSNRLEMYKSNVWIIFPRLRVLTMQISSIEEHRNGGEWLYRREIYDKFQNSKII